MDQGPPGPAGPKVRYRSMCPAGMKGAMEHVDSRFKWNERS